ncbi:related to ATPases [Cephalotrichum gorgonifer]|uniref:Phospholipid-transporting ATPase n=1 Tax=Cephalotrichum gorgonifer TaxID=2041049 RepID=A0AAE8SZH3_9PEZI|nr:related to ATPases [Cephalotrichum gorgonifer]
MAEKTDENQYRPKSPAGATASAATVSEYKMFVRPGPGNRSRFYQVRDTVKRRAGQMYRQYVIEGLLRQKPLPPTKDGRHIPLDGEAHCPQKLVDERTGKPYISNFIRSSRYTLWDFLPKQLIFQFSRLANFYFLVIGIMQMIPGLSTTGKYTTIIPLAIFVTFSMAKEGYDDYRRYTLDKMENSSDAWVLRGTKDASGMRRTRRPWDVLKHRSKLEQTEGQAPVEDVEDPEEVESDGEWMRIKWAHVKVGDVVRLSRDDNVPADLVLLYASGPNGVAYIETMALDGETNLKSKQACPLLAERCRSVDSIRSCKAEIVSEDPNLDLYSYDGRITVDGETLPLTTNNVAYRGSTVRNTAKAIGLVINSGEECKIRMNAAKSVRAKAPKIQNLVNKIVLFLVFFVVMVSVGVTIGYYRWKDREGHLWYLMGAGLSFKNIFIAFIIMFNTLIPLSLYISLEIIKLGQLYFLGDVEMYDPVSNTPMVANTMTILENLGQVNYVFSDKTGTLTDNVMRFRKMSVAGAPWLHDMNIKRDEEEKRRKIEASERLRKSKKKAAKQAAKPQGKLATDSEDYEPVSPGIETNIVDEYGVAVPEAGVQGHGFGAAASSAKSMRGVGGSEPKTESLLAYLRDRPNTTFSRKARHFIICMALCNTCLPEIKEDGSIEYQAASPDELALVEAARDLGYEMVDRPSNTIKLKYPDAKTGKSVVEVFEVLDVIEFTSKRKRMSIIIRMPDGRVCIFCKGADSALLPRLKLSKLAIQKAREVEQQANRRRSQEQESAFRRLSMQSNTPRTSLALSRVSVSGNRPAMGRIGSIRASLDNWRRSTEVPESSADARVPRRSMGDMKHDPRRTSLALSTYDVLDGLVDESAAANEGTIFERCFQHTDDFAAEGLRTLLFAYRYVEEDDYRTWKKIYFEATTSLVDRQERIEAAGELIEQKFDLAGATAIEDKLQEGVPETIDKLRRANIKVWMLTGDKRETAINIGHSARLCKPFSEVYILDANLGNLSETMRSSLMDVSRGMVPHSVVVIDGQTLSDVDEDKGLSELFYDLAVRVDSVICCRASPSQKAKLVKRIRHRVPNTMTLAIGDGANDIGMILASHVGVGISGREGLQAARIADYSIAQFRFLQRLLFVHGRWTYIRTSKYVLATFWKEIFFFMGQAHFQTFTGYTGTSLYENWSLTIFNGVFTSIPVIILGILEQDLKADTLLRFPELYNYGQRSLGFNFRNFLGWATMAALESCILFYGVWGVYRMMLFTEDATLYAMGTMAFTVGVLFINIKLLVLEMHNKTIASLIGLGVSTLGWFLWMLIIGEMYPDGMGIYLVDKAFLHNFGHTLTWWTGCLLILLTLIVVELTAGAIRRVYFPGDWDVMQRAEKDGSLEEAGDNGGAEREGADVEMVEVEVETEGRPSMAVVSEAGAAASPGLAPGLAPPGERRSFQGGRPSLQDKRGSFHEGWRPRPSHDGYVPPAFTTLEEERK